MASINQHWLKQIGSKEQDIPFEMVIDSTDHIIIAGYTSGTIPGALTQNRGYEDAWLAKYNNHGEQIWARQIGSSKMDLANGLALDQEDNIYLCGYTKGRMPKAESSGQWDAWIAKYSPTGKQIWIKQFGSFEYDSASAIAINRLGHLYIAGWTVGTMPGADREIEGWGDAFLAQFNLDGEQIWIRQIGKSKTTQGLSIATDQSGNAFIGGRTMTELMKGKEDSWGDPWLAKYDSFGQQIWLQQLGSERRDTLTQLTTDIFGNLYAMGTTTDLMPGVEGKAQFGNDAWVAKFDQKGNQHWIKQFITSYSEEAGGISTDHYGNIFICGATSQGMPEAQNPIKSYGEGWLSKLDTNGEIQWVYHIGSEKRDRVAAIRLDSQSNIFVAGDTLGQLTHETPAGSNDIWLACYEELFSEREEEQRLLIHPLYDNLYYLNERILQLEDLVEQLVSKIDPTVIKQPDPLPIPDDPVDQKLDKELFRKIRRLTASNMGDGRISFEDAKVIWKEMNKNQQLSEVEIRTVFYAKEQLNFTEKAWTWLKQQIEDSRK